MTENPTQGAGTNGEDPENRNQWRRPEPQQPRAAADQPTESNPTQANPTERLERQGGSAHSEQLADPHNGTRAVPPAAPTYPAHEPTHSGASFTQPQQAAPTHQYGQAPQYGQADGSGQYQQGQAPQQGPGNQYGQQHHYGATGLATAPNPAHAPRRKAAFGVGTLVASILAAGLVGGGVATVASGNWFADPSTASGGSSNSQPSSVIVNNTDSVNAITAAAQKASPSVVTISASSGSEGGTGSGIVLDDQGHILTNTHVVTLDGATANATLEVRTSDGRVLAATVVGIDPLSDLAVIKVDSGSGLTPATLGDSGALNVGDTAIAIGSPLGLTGTVTDGIVSTLNRTISVASSAAPEEGDNTQGSDEGGFQFAPPGGGNAPSTASKGSIAINVIQTDAAINPGNSGGALVNSKGEIIGVNVAIASAGSDSSSTSSGNIGVGFSIPINNAKRVAQEIIDTGKASHGQLGVSVSQKSSTDSSSGFSVGADVAKVEEGSAAANAGIKAGDVITKFNDLTISDPNQLTAAVREQPANSKVKITFTRGSQEQTVDVTLGAAAE
ncbi:trypsin-like peptidase domain-containing protein [Pseudarthrobacter sp. PS3-L1]|uniref:trypsin-like peptidase domain-containing protein n=1 Tax=Pseudarthrobacter sp. PS3-L1 TaxID=3046207 RepID=UPI0024B8ABAD|nr:trypsin-like peptidase domain-containing protein [Pseudarthrobacter sp. PS3-L1]MDJ0321461.1 trypsin-like peptidase domain-containing protein [Pseudarthrobacter sp. PS3-L1]